MRFPLGPWEPDAAGVDSGVLATAKNVYPTKIGYAPIRSLAATTANALPAKCVGMIAVRTSSGGWLIFAGTSTHLYKYVAGAWVDYTRVSGGNYNVPTDEFWSFTQFNSKLIAVNANDNPQVIDVDSGATNFSALSGSPPISRYVGVVGSFVVLGAQTANPTAVMNSAIGDETGWTAGVNLCSQQIFPDGGRVTGVAGGEFGWVAQERSIRRMIFQPGNDTAFRYERVESEHGCAAGYGLVGTANQIFFPSNDGFYSYGADGLIPIGAQKVNKWFQTNCDSARFFSVIAFADPYAPRICWAFYNSSGSQNFDRLICYDWQLQRWSYAEVSAQFWASITTAGTTLEQLDAYGDIDSGLIPYPFDSRAWEGGAPVIAAIDTNFLLSFLEGGTPLSALLDTAPIHINPGFRSTVKAVYPLGILNDASISLRVGRRENTSNAVNYTSSITPSSSSGIIRTKASGRVHDFELTLSQSSGTSWSQIQGIDIDTRQGGMK